MDKMMEQHINYMNSPVTEMIDFFETRGNILEFKQEEKKYSASLKDKWSKKNKSQKMKRHNSDSSVIESSQEVFVDYKPEIRKYYVLRKKYNHTMDICKDFRL